MMFKTAIHLTSPYHWKKIQETKVLEPLTEPVLSEGVAPQIKAKVAGNKYLVTIPEEALAAWEEYGLLQAVEKKAADHVGVIGCAGATRESYLILKIPVLDDDKIFVKEHRYPTCKYGDQFMPGAVIEVEYESRSCGMSTAKPKEREFVNRLWEQYNDSAVLFAAYPGNFVVPELWLPQRTPINLIEILQDYPIPITKRQRR